MAAHNPRFTELCNAARKNIREFTVAEIAERRKRGETFILVDVREESEWNKDHLPQAVYLGKGVIERDIEKTIPDARADIVLYCGGGFRSALAAENLKRMGYTNVSSMDGGYKGWVAAGLPLEK